MIIFELTKNYPFSAHLQKKYMLSPTYYLLTAIEENTEKYGSSPSSLLNI